MASNSRLKRIRKKRTVLREHHYHTQGGICVYCECVMHDDVSVNKDNYVTLEHILPQLFGGADTEVNTVAVCSDCNMRRSNRVLSAKMLGRILRRKTVKQWPTILLYHVQTHVRLRRHTMTPFR